MYFLLVSKYAAPNNQYFCKQQKQPLAVNRIDTDGNDNANIITNNFYKTIHCTQCQMTLCGILW